MRSLAGWSTPVGALGLALIVGALLMRIVVNPRTDILLLLGAIGVVCVGFYLITRPRDGDRRGWRTRVLRGKVSTLSSLRWCLWEFSSLSTILLTSNSANG